MPNMVLNNVRPFVDGKFGEPTKMCLVDGKWADSAPEGTPEFDAKGALALPALFGLGLDFKEPLRDDIYTFKDGVSAMRRGGFFGGLYESSANPIDDSQKLTAMQQLASKSGLEFAFLGAFSMGYQCKDLAEMMELAQGGAVGFGDGNHNCSRSRFLRLAMEYGSMTGKRFFFMPLDDSLRHHGLVHEGSYSDTLGMKGIPRIAETIAAFRILEMARFLKVPVHFKQVSCGETLKLVETARAQGVDVTCDVDIYHLLLSVNHDPVLRQDKEVNFEDAVPGAVSLEVALGAIWKPLSGRLGAARAVELLSTAPAQLAGVEPAALRKGGQASLVLLDQDRPTKVVPAMFAGKTRNTPLLGKELPSSIVASYINGVWTEV